MSSEPLPIYDPSAPAQQQDADYDCSQESAQWCLRAWGRSPDDAWMTDSLISEGVMSPALGLLDASGAGMADWFNRHYGGPEDGYLASNNGSVSFDEVAAEAGEGVHPLMLGGRSFYHWVGCRGYESSRDLLLIANSARGYQGVYDSLSRQQWAALGSWSLVRLTHPAAEGEIEMPPMDYSLWEGQIGSGLLEMLAEDDDLPAQDYSTWLPLGRMPAQIEEVIGEQGCVYRWVLSVNRGFRYRPS